jgi:hypothetical protein
MRKIISVVILALSLNAFSQIPTNGLVGWYPFNGNANDESTFANNGSLFGGVTMTLDRFGLANSAFNFNGIDSYIVTQNGGPLGQTSRTFSFWFKTNSPNEQMALVYGDPNGNGGCFDIAFNNPCSGIGVDVSNGVIMKSDNSILDNQWHHCIIIFDSDFSNTIDDIVLYIDGVMQSSITCSALNNSASINTMSLNPYTIGKDFSAARFFEGSIDDIGIWDRVLTPTEIEALYNYVPCSDTTVSVTQTIYVSDETFQSISPKTYLDGIDTLTTIVGECDSIVKRYTNFVFQANYCTDTTYITIQDTNYTFITVTDTLIINANISGLISPNNLNTIKVYPNPANTHITIDYGNFISMNGYSIKIINFVSQEVFSSFISQQSSFIDLSTWTGNGVYYLQIIDPQNNVIENRKIVIQ